MRPVERDSWPMGDDGLPIRFDDYREAKPELVRRLGAYCSYCELPLDNAPTVEHKEPKFHVPHLETMWCNFLLACAYCQGCKGDTRITLNDYFWPDQDNTLRAFYYEHMLVATHPDLDEQHSARARAEATMSLVGLDKVPGSPREPSDLDPRWRKRVEVWGKANLARRRLHLCATDALRDQIEDTATSSGCFSIWMTVFDSDADMRRRFIRAFRGTSVECFDDGSRPRSRPGGSL
jgi:hypothetical protein